MRQFQHILKYSILLFVSLQLFNISAQAKTIDDVRALIDTYYVDEIDSATLNQQSIDDILSNLDPYSTHFTAEEAKEFLDALNQEYVGVGIMVEQQDTGVIITKVFDHSPAQQAGLKPGDLIVEVNSMDVKGSTIEQVVGKIKGPENTEVEISVLREGQIITIQANRQAITLPTVESKRLGGNIGYISVASFNTHTLPEMKTHMSLLSGVESWIIDLRYNPGGLVSAAQYFVGLFPTIENALFVETIDTTSFYKAIPPPQMDYFEQPVSMLINKQSASASEIVAGAVQDGNAATLYGETTFGKGLMQSLFNLENGEMLKLTIARFYTPNKHMIQDKGITPDIITDMPLEAAHKDSIKKQHENYMQLPSLNQVSVNKQFVINFNTSVVLESITKETVHLIELGGERVELSIESVDHDTLRLTPILPLQSQGEYILLVHPAYTSNNGVNANQGVIIEVSVE